MIATHTETGKAYIDYTTLFKFYQRLETDNTAREIFVTLTKTFVELCGTSLNLDSTTRIKVKVRERMAPKYYWFDPGVARAAAGLIHEPVDKFWKGFALETLIFHELRVYNETYNRFRPIRYYRTASGVEIDFVIETKKQTSGEAAHIICIEVKLASKWNRKWEYPMRSLDQQDTIHVDRMIGIYMGNRTYNFDGVDIYPVTVFLEKLYNQEIF